ncbi:MAG: ABC transporter permease [Chloroflexota bacterium]|jgi:ABC-type polysaccharide/polyol phosphate export permease
MVAQSETSKEVRIIDSNVDWRNWRKSLKESFRYRYLLQNLVKRDVKVRYRNSVLGVIWSLLNPLLMMLVFTFVFSRFMPNEGVRSYAIFVLVGLLPWQFFTGTMLSGTTSVTNGAPMIRKVYFPRELLPASAMLSSLVNFLLASVVLVAFLYVFRIGLTQYALWVPVLLFTQMLFMLGLILFLSTINVFYRDVMMILDVVLLAWFFLTPVVYPLEWLGNQQTIFGITFDPAVVMRWLNPMASIIDGYRTVLWGNMASDGPATLDPSYLLRTMVTAGIIFVVGYFMFARFQHIFAEKL